MTDDLRRKLLTEWARHDYDDRLPGGAKSWRQLDDVTHYRLKERIESLYGELFDRALMPVITDALAEADDAGRKHLREVHDEAEAAAKYARDTTPDWEYLRSLAHKAPRVRRQVSTYCRAHGCHRDICGCGRSHTPKPPENRSDFVPTISAACIGGDARTQIHICTKCGLVSTCNRQPNGARA